MRTVHERVMTNASRCADIVRVAGAQALSNALLTQGYTDCWYAYTFAATTTRRLESRHQFVASGKWRERMAMYATARRAIWQEMVKRGLRQEAPVLPTPTLDALKAPEPDA